MIEVIFWASLLFITYAYLGYPLLLRLMLLFRNRPVNKANITPTISVIVTAYNEEGLIQEKIENTLKQTYPREKLQIIVASDCSTDNTDAIVKAYQCQGVTLVRGPERKGKENAQKQAIDIASGEILVFSDVATILSVDALSHIVKNFHDPTVGCVSSVDRFIEADGKISGEGAYIRYEMFIRNLETNVNTLVGLSGSFFAARKEMCQIWAVDLQSDFNTLLHTVKAGLRGVADPESIGYYKNIADERQEFDRKVRTVLRGIAVFMRNLSLLNPLRYGLFSWQLFSHKLCRWLVPFAMVLAFFSNAFLLPSARIYTVFFLIQLTFYTLGIWWFWTGTFGKIQFLKIPSFLILSNLSILRAWYQYAQGKRLMTWNPSKR
jgi:cellulose synthase/poly-beta-1,6-N-acetylglucosamine synthase-like glycosyltransferase